MCVCPRVKLKLPYHTTNGLDVVMSLSFTTTVPFSDLCAFKVIACASSDNALCSLLPLSVF